MRGGECGEAGEGVWRREKQRSSCLLEGWRSLGTAACAVVPLLGEKGTRDTSPQIPVKPEGVCWLGTLAHSPVPLAHSSRSADKVSLAASVRPIPLGLARLPLAPCRRLSGPLSAQHHSHTHPCYLLTLGQPGLGWECAW